MTINYPALTNTIKALSESGNSILVDKLLDILQHNAIPKSKKSNQKKDITTSHFVIDLDDKEVGEIIEILQEIQLKFVGEGEGNDHEYYYYLELIDSWI